MARLRSPFTEWPPMAVLGRSDDPALARKICRRARRGIGGGRHLARLRAGARHPHQSEESGHRRSGARRKAGDRREARPRHHRGAAARGRRGVRQTFSRARRYRHRLALRAADRRARARSAARHRVRAVQGGHRGSSRVHHDGARARGVDRRRAAGDAVAEDRPGHSARRARLRRRHRFGRPRDEGDRRTRTRQARPPCWPSPPDATLC